MASTGKKGGKKHGAAGKSSNTKAKKGSQRGGRAGPAALSVPFGIVAPSTAKPDALTPEGMFEGPPVASVKALRPTLQRLVFDPDLWLRAFQRSGGFGRRRRSSSVDEKGGAEGREETGNDIGDTEEEEEGTDRIEDERGDDAASDHESDDDAEQRQVVEGNDIRSSEEEEEEADEKEEENSGHHGEVETRFNSAKLKQLRQIVQIGTIDAVLRGKYFLADRPTEAGQELVVREVHLNKRAMQKAASATKMYASDHVYPRPPAAKKPAKGSPQSKTEIFVVEGDCLEAALIMKNQRGLRPAVLNMASRSNPCGGYRHGTGAQEESLTRRSNLFQCLEDPYRTDTGRQWSYPLPEFGGLYTPDLTVFRRSEDAGYAFMDEPQYLSIISVAAYSNPPVEEIDGELRLSGPAIVNNFKKKIKAILSIALDNGHDSVVLGAFGCGVFGNPPKHIAQLFGEVLRKDFANCFEMVVFAIIDGLNSFQWFNPQGNVLPFSQAFKCNALTLEELAERIARDDNAKEERGDKADRKTSRPTGSSDGAVPDDVTTTEGGRRRRRASGKSSTKAVLRQRSSSDEERGTTQAL